MQGKGRSQAMTAGFSQRMEQVNMWLMLLLAFFLPLSTSVISVLACLIVLGWVVEGRYREKLATVLSNRVCLAVLAYIALMILGLLWTDDIASGLEFLAKRWKFMLMPLFLTLVVYEKRRWYMGAFVLGMSVAMAMTYLAWFDLLHYADVTPEHLTKKTFHVVYNPLLAIAIYMVAHELFWGKVSGRSRFLGFFLLGAMCLNMFVTEGRAGQLVFFALAGLIVVQKMRRNVVLALATVAIVLPLVFSAGYVLSPRFQERVDLARQEIAQFEQNPNTSVGLRLLYWHNSFELIKAHPWFGVGTGDFDTEYAAVNQQHSPEIAPTDNPHSQYFLVGSRFGLVGVVVMLSIFFLQFQQARQHSDGLQRMRCAFPLFFLVIMLTESYLVVYETGFFFSLFCAVLYRQPPQTSIGTAS